jgi:hypothetical protein
LNVILKAMTAIFIWKEHGAKEVIKSKAIPVTGRGGP